MLLLTFDDEEATYNWVSRWWAPMFLQLLASSIAAAFVATVLLSLRLRGWLRESDDCAPR